MSAVLSSKNKLRLPKTFFKSKKKKKFQLLSDDEEEIEEIPENKGEKPRFSQCFRVVSKMFRSKKRKRQEAIEKAYQKCNLALDALIERELPLLKQVEKMGDQITVYTKGNKIPQAIVCLRRKKYHEKELANIRTQKFNLESQIQTLKQNDSNYNLFETMKAVKGALRKVQRNYSEVDLIYDDFQELLDITHEQSAQLSQEFSGYIEYTDDELRSEILGQTPQPPKPPFPPVEHALLADTRQLEADMKELEDAFPIAPSSVVNKNAQAEESKLAEIRVI